MFELKEAIQNWRGSLLQNQNVLESDADELESHMRDEVDSLMLAGLSVEEAFMVSAHRIGDQETVGREYAKVNPKVAWKRRIFWMLFGILIAIILNTLAQLTSGISALLLVKANLSNTLSVVITSAVYMGTFAGILLIIILAFDAINQVYKRMFTTSMFLLAGVIGLMLLKVCGIALNILNVRLVPMEQMQQIVITSKLAGFVWSVFWPIALITLLFILWPSRPQKAR